jgi:hypothetical protein
MVRKEPPRENSKAKRAYFSTPPRHRSCSKRTKQSIYGSLLPLRATHRSLQCKEHLRISITPESNVPLPANCTPPPPELRLVSLCRRRRRRASCWRRRRHRSDGAWALRPWTSPCTPSRCPARRAARTCCRARACRWERARWVVLRARGVVLMACQVPTNLVGLVL